MAIPPNLELVAHGERPRSALARLYLEHERLAIGGGTLVAVLLVWEALGRSGLIDPLFISFPTQVAQAGWQLSHDRDFWNDVEVSASEFILGYGAALALAIPLGLAVGLSKRLQYMISPFVDTLNAVPRVTLLPLIIIWFGIGIWSKVVVVFLGAVIPILINTQSGVKTSEARFIRVARSFSASRLKIFSSIILPGTVPFIFTGLKYGAGRALLGVVVGELYASTAGLGHMIADAGNTFQTDIVFFGVLVFMLFLIGWEGLERGWWADMLRPLLGASAERLQLKPIFISSPTLIAAAAFRMFFVTGEIWRDLAWSGVGYVLGLGLAIAVGIPLGLAAGWYRRFSYAVEPFLSALNATPQVAFLPLIVVWVGTGLGERVLIIFLLAVLPLAINAHAAVRTTDPRLVKVASSLGAGDWRLFRTIILPSSLPFLLAGLRLAIGRGMIGVVVGEIYGSAAGIGAMINQAGARFQTDKVFVGVLTIVAAGVVLVEIVQRIERRVDVWRAPA